MLTPPAWRRTAPPPFAPDDFPQNFHNTCGNFQTFQKLKRAV
jgi:hypothetical protein